LFRTTKASAVIALCCTVAGGLLAGCDEDSEPDEGASQPSATTTARQADAGLLSGTTKITVDGRSVNVSCSGSAGQDRPVVVLMAGLGDGLDKPAGLQKTLSEKTRVCSYDRLGEGASDQPDGPQSFGSSGRILTGVLARAAGAAPVVLAGHSLGGMIAARYAPDHKDKVKGLVLMDATPPTTVADTMRFLPETATGPAAELRAQSIAVYSGENPERLVVTDGEVRSAGDIPVEVIQHGQQYLAAVPDYGPALEQAWSAGQRKWLGLSSRSKLSTATNSGHYIYVDQPDLAVQAVQRVIAQVTP
jgi:pimeloyl-ACP methyl ester carboxylesterase